MLYKECSDITVEYSHTMTTPPTLKDVNLKGKISQCTDECDILHKAFKKYLNPKRIYKIKIKIKKTCNKKNSNCKRSFVDNPDKESKQLNKKIYNYIEDFSIDTDIDDGMEEQNFSIFKYYKKYFNDDGVSQPYFIVEYNDDYLLLKPVFRKAINSTNKYRIFQVTIGECKVKKEFIF